MQSVFLRMNGEGAVVVEGRSSSRSARAVRVFGEELRRSLFEMEGFGKGDR